MYAVVYPQGTVRGKWHGKTVAAGVRQTANPEDYVDVPTSCVFIVIKRVRCWTIGRGRKI